MNNILHISTHYFPVNGGQQIYIENFRHAFPKFNHYVVQIGTPGVQYPPHVTPIAIPRSFKYRAVAFFYFNAQLQRVIRDLADRGLIDPAKDLAICHYAFHYRAVKSFKRRLILSHGVEWDGPGSFVRKTYHRFRRQVNARLIQDDRCLIVANDINYFRQLGVAGISAANAFSEVRPGKWLIPNSVDTERFVEAQSSRQMFPKPAIVIPRNIVPQRGIDVVIRAFATLVDRIPHNLYIVGAKYDTQYYSRLVAIVQQLGLKDRVVFHGPAPYDRMNEVYNSCDLVVIFSLFREGTSLAALEAMSAGTAVLTSDVGGLKDIPSVKATAENLGSKIAETLAQRRKIAAAQRDVVRKLYTARNWVCAWSAVLETAIATD